MELKNSLTAKGLLSSLGVLAYIMLVVLLMNSLEGSSIGENENFFGPAAFLLLFTLSAAIVGFLVFGRPIMMYINGQKKEAVLLLGYTIAFLAIEAIIVIGIAFMLADPSNI